MANYWFRMYSEVLEDPKVQRLSAENFRYWVNILCVVSRQDAPALPPIEDLAFMLRLSEKAASKVVDELVSANLLDRTAQGLEPHNWRKRQYKSDVSTERVKRYRAKNETFHEADAKRFRNGNGDVSETPPELDTELELDTESEKNTKSAGKPRHIVKPPEVESQVWEDFKTLRKAKRATLTETALLGIERQARMAGLSLNDALKMCCERGWQGFKAEWVDTRNALEKQTDEILGIDRRQTPYGHNSDPSGMAESEYRSQRSGRGLVRFGE